MNGGRRFIHAKIRFFLAYAQMVGKYLLLFFSFFFLVLSAAVFARGLNVIDHWKYYAMLLSGLSMLPAILALPLMGKNLKVLLEHSDPDCSVRSATRTADPRIAEIIERGVPHVRKQYSRFRVRLTPSTIAAVSIALVAGMIFQFSSYSREQQVRETGPSHTTVESGLKIPAVKQGESDDESKVLPPAYGNLETKKKDQAGNDTNVSPEGSGSGRSEIISSDVDGEKTKEKKRSAEGSDTAHDVPDASGLALPTEGSSGPAREKQPKGTGGVPTDESATDPETAARGGTGKSGFDHAGDTLIPSPLLEYTTYRDSIAGKSMKKQARTSNTEADPPTMDMLNDYIGAFQGAVQTKSSGDEFVMALSDAWKKMCEALR